jgi:hypothetical protein
MTASNQLPKRLEKYAVMFEEVSHKGEPSLKTGECSVCDGFRSDLAAEFQHLQEECEANFIERLKNAMDKYNSLPENAMQFAFYLKIQDTAAFFKALTTKNNKKEKNV